MQQAASTGHECQRNVADRDLSSLSSPGRPEQCNMPVHGPHMPQMYSIGTPTMPCVGSHMDVLQQVSVLIGRMTPQQAQAAQGILNEQLGRQARGVPEHFGRMPMHPDAAHTNFVIPPSIDQGLSQNYQGSEGVDVFSRADKWLGQPPSPSVQKWTSRELGIAGFADYVVSLQSWVALGSMTFSEEISVSLRWPDTIWQQTLKRTCRKSDR